MNTDLTKHIASWNPVRQAPDIPVYHYCDALAFRGIVSSRQLWASHVSSMRDNEEYIWLLRLAREEFQKRALRPESFTPRIQELSKDTELFLCCFSYARDSPILWPSHGRNGEGLAIGFNYSRLSPYVFQPMPFTPPGHESIHCVVYDDQQHLEEIHAFIADLEKTGSAENFVMNLLSSAAVTKRASFKWENELRLVIFDKVSEPARKIKTRTENVGPIKYVEFGFDSLSIRHVIRGPNCPLSLKETRKVLAAAGFGHIKVLDSLCIRVDETENTTVSSKTP